MATPDIRVRLSAEGVQDVVNALKRVRGEAKKAGKESAQGFNALNSSISTLSRLLPTIAIGATIRELIKAGLAAERLAAQFRAVAGTDMHRELQFAREVAERLGLEITQTAQSYARFMIATKGTSIEGETARQVFEGIATAMSAMKLSVQEQGRAWVQLNQMMSKGKVNQADLKVLAESLPGIYQAIAAALGITTGELMKQMEAGKVMATDVLPKLAAKLMETYGDVAKESAEGAAAGFNRFKNRIVELAQAIGTALTPAFTQVLKVIEKGVNLLKQFTAGIEITALKTGAWFWGASEAEVEKDVQEILRRYFPTEFGPQTAKSQTELIEEQTRNDERARKEREAAERGARDNAAKKLIKAEEAAAKARLGFKKAALDNEIKLIEAYSKLLAERDKAAYEEGLLSLREYYARRRETALSEIDRELSALEAKKKIAGKAPANTEADKVKRAQEVAAIQAQMDLKKTERLRIEEALTQEERQAVRHLASERLQLEQKLLEAQGQRHEAALLALDEELRKTDELLKKQGVAEAERTTILGRQRTVGEAGIEFERLKEQAEAQFSDIEAARREIQAQVQQGLIFEFEGEDKIIALEKERLPLLREIAAEMQLVAEATGDPANIAQVRELNAAIQELEVSTDLAGQRMAEFRETLFSASTGALAQFFMDVSSGTESVKDSFRNMALSVIKSLQQMLAQMIAFAAMKAVFGAFGVPVGTFAGGGAVKAASGGFIKGPGTGTSDSVPAWLSNGEFVVRSAIVNRPGVLNHLKELNRGMVQPSIRQTVGIRRFAEGGLVSAEGKASLDSNLTVGLESGLVLKELSSPEGQRVLVRLLGQNKRAARQAIGG